MSLRPDETGLRRLDLNLPPVFAALMRERGVTRAGRALFLSRPAASAALARLRAALKDELLVRNGRPLEPTARATSLMAELEPCLSTRPPARRDRPARRCTDPGPGRAAAPRGEARR